jgi:hypothetical protein
MSKKNYSARFQDFREKEEMIQNSYLRLVCEIKSNIIENLPFESYLQLTRNHNDLKTHGEGELFVDRLQVLLIQDTVLLQELINILPNADKQTILNDFNSFRKQFLGWIKEYCFEKDWIITSALKTLAHNRERFLKKENQMKVFGWRVSLSGHTGLNPKRELGIQEKMDIYIENWTSFENRVKQKMKELEKQYKERAKNHTFKTKDFDMEKLRWLALWNIKRWTVSEIATKECGIKPVLLPDEDDPFERIKLYIYKEIQRLKDYDLPVRKKNSRN